MTMDEKSIKPRHKLMHQLSLVYAGILIIAIALSSIVVYRICTNKAIDDMVDKSVETMDLQLDYIKIITDNLSERFFTQYNSDELLRRLKSIAKNPVGVQRLIDENRLKDMLSEILATDNLLQGILLMDKAGQFVYVNRLGHEKYAQLLKAMTDCQDKIRIKKGAVHWMAVDGRVVMARMVYDANTLSHVGYISAYVDGAQLAKKCGLRGDGRVPEMYALKTADDQPLLTSPGSAALWADVVKKYPIVPGGGLETKVAVDGGQGILLGKSDSYGDWTLYNLTGMERFSVGWESVIVLILPLCFALLVGSVIFSTVKSADISKKVKLLLLKMVSISARDFSGSLRFTRQDELDMLAHYLNRLGIDMDRLITENQNNEHLRYEILHAKYAMLQSNLNPHLIYNFLETISSQAMMRDVPEISRNIRLFSDFLRANIRRSSHSVTLGEEIENVHRYVSIYQSVYPKRIEMRYDIDPALKGMTVPGFILQPLVENAIVHGAEQSARPIHISLRCAREGARALLEVIDDSIGIALEDLRAIRANLQAEADDSNDGRRAHFGLKSIHTILRLKYGQGYGLTIDSAQGAWTRVCLALPFELDQSTKSEK